ncbi:MAG: hypothetical protein U0I22_05665 [Treponema sp.]|nr:hypothetical protein [Treponema sp.]
MPNSELAQRKAAVGCWHPPPLLISLNLCYTAPHEGLLTAR